MTYKPYPSKNYMDHKFRKRDNIFDLETLTNVFTCVFYNPASDTIIISYIDDDNIIKDDNAKSIIKERIFLRNKNLPLDAKIYWENLRHWGSTTMGIPGMSTFIKRFGVTNNEKMLNVKIDDRKSEYPAEFYPVKDTDPDYDKDKHGMFFGYNSSNYDLTVIAYMISEIDTSNFKKNLDAYADSGVIPASEIREFNDELFSDDFKKNMPSRLAKQTYVQKYVQNNITKSRLVTKNNYRSLPWSIRKSWLLTNRFIDVSKLNEKMQKVALKRLLGMLGFQILESDKLENETHIKNLDEMADLIGYNVSDDINLKYLFLHKAYYNSFSLKSAMLAKYKEAIYEKDPLEYKAYDKEDKYLHVRRDRLCSDSTSAKFVEFVIAPYNKLIDDEKVSFMYPHPSVCKRLTRERKEKARAEGKTQAEIDAILIEPTDVLEDTKVWFEDHVAKPGTQAHDQFMDVYHFYSHIRGHNFNASDSYAEEYGFGSHYEDSSYIKGLMKKYNTNLFYFDKNQERTSCIANFSIGGIHGAEIKLDLYQQHIDEYNDKIKLLDWVATQYGGPDKDATEAINGPAKIELPDGSVTKIRDFMKSGSTRKKATWREYKKPELFKNNSQTGKIELSKKYTYVSIGPSNHEDFTSYYPLLLSMLAVFVNPDRGVDAEGNGIDPYYGLFETRVEMKHKAHDINLSDEIREQAELEQLLMKLLLNAASGAADATFDNNIRVNNKTIAMRIIGQLFAWRIGQAQTLEGARVPSTNTDGLYTMDIDWELNNKILFDVADSMYIGIEPERIERFVSKDSNNRMEYGFVPADASDNFRLMYDKKRESIASAKGGSLNSWGGPWPEQSLDHPAAIDNALAYYLSEHDDPANTPFDTELAKSIFARIISENKDTPQEALRFFQWILASSSGTHRYVFTQEVNVHTGEIIENKNIQHYNRIFMTRPTGNTIKTVKMATHRKVLDATLKKRMKNNEPTVQHNNIAVKILGENGYDIINNPETRAHEAQIIKIKSMPSDQNVDVINTDLWLLSNKEAYNLLSKIDPNAYMKLLESTFWNSWTNIEIPKEIEESNVEN